MTKFYVMGCYTDKGLAGFVNNPSTNRAAATKAIVEAGGAKLLDYSLLRGAFDFIASSLLLLAVSSLSSSQIGNTWGLDSPLICPTK